MCKIHQNTSQYIKIGVIAQTDSPWFSRAPQILKKPETVLRGSPVVPWVVLPP